MEFGCLSFADIHHNFAEVARNIYERRIHSDICQCTCIRYIDVFFSIQCTLLFHATKFKVDNYSRNPNRIIMITRPV